MEIIALLILITTVAIIAFLSAKLQDALRRIGELEKENKQLDRSARRDGVHQMLHDNGEQMAFNLALLEEDYQIQGERIKFMKRLADLMMNEPKPKAKK